VMAPTLGLGGRVLAPNRFEALSRLTKRTRPRSAE
jgi:hypothetical protein